MGYEFVAFITFIKLFMAIFGSIQNGVLHPVSTYPNSWSFSFNQLNGFWILQFFLYFSAEQPG